MSAFTKIRTRGWQVDEQVRPSRRKCLDEIIKQQITANHRLSLRCPSKKEKCKKHKGYSRQAEAKKDHRVERGVPGHCPIAHGQLSYGPVLSELRPRCDK